MRFAVLFAVSALAGCSESGVKKVNANPEAWITSHADGDSVIEGTTETVRGQVSDPDHALTELGTSWFYNGDPVCPDAEPDGTGAVDCELTFTTEGGEIVLEVRDPAGALASARVTLGVAPSDAPTAAIAAPTADGVYYSDALITFEGTVADTEDAAESLTVQWTSDATGAIEGDFNTPGTEGALLGAASLDEGEHFITLTATDSTGKEGTDSVVITVGPPNSAPDCAISAPVDGSAGPEGALVMFTGTVSDADVAANLLSVDWSSDKDGPIGSSTPDSEGAVSFPYEALTINTHVVTLTATDEMGASCAANVVYTVGTPPVLNITAPTDGDILSHDAPVVFEATVEDNEDTPDAVALSWESDLDGVFSTSGADSAGAVTVSADALSAGEHLVTVTATDTHGLFVTDTVSFTLNQTPVIDSVTIEPDPAYNDDTLTCIATASDPDGGWPSISYEWTGGATGPELPLTSVIAAPGDTIACTATATDSAGATATGSGSITIGNRDPVVTVTLAPATPTRHDTLTCTAAIADPDDDATGLEFAWTVDATPATATSTAESSSTLEGAFSAGQTVTCTATGDDARGGTGSDSASVEITNTAPEVTSVSLMPSELYTNDTATALASTTDADGDELTVSYAFAVDGSVVQEGELNTLDGVVHFDKGQTVTVTATARDETEEHSLSSAIVEVLNSPPTAPVISIHAAEELSCDEGWTLSPEGARCLKAFPEPQSWNDAAANCASYGGNLVTLNSYEEQLEIAELFRAAEVGDHDYFFIGYTDRDSEGTFTWTSGSDSTYSHWGSGEPNDCCGGQDCTMVTNHAEGYWDDIDCDDVTEFGSMCEVALGGSAGMKQWRIEDGGNDHWYAVRSSSETITWSDAFAAAEAEGGHLVTLTSEDENNWVYSALLTDESVWMMGEGHARGPYIGLYETGGAFEWVTGEPLEFTNWVPGDPNGSGPDDVGSFYTFAPATGTTWSDEDFDSTGYHYLVEWPDSPGGELVCTIDEESTDADGDPITYTFDWDVDGSAFTDTDTTTHEGDTVPGEDVGFDEVWTCEVTPNDGEDDGESATATHESECAIGSEAACPALDCNDLLLENPDAPSGIYWIQPLSDVYEVQCNMDTDGGGWTLVMKAVDSNFLYSDAVWTTEILHDETDLELTAAGEAKYQSFNEVPFDEILTTDPADFGISHSEVTDTTRSSALEHFSGQGDVLYPATYENYFNDRTPAYWGAWGCSEYDRYGFNLYESLGCVYIAAGMGCDHNGGARWGNRINGWYEGGGNLTGQGWANYSCSASTMPGVDTGTGTLYVSTIRELMWVR